MTNRKEYKRQAIGKRAIKYDLLYETCVELKLTATVIFNTGLGRYCICNFPVTNVGGGSWNPGVVLGS